MDIFKGNCNNCRLYQYPLFFILCKDVLEISFPIPPTMSSYVGYWSMALYKLISNSAYPALPIKYADVFGELF